MLCRYRPACSTHRCPVAVMPRVPASGAAVRALVVEVVDELGQDPARMALASAMVAAIARSLPESRADRGKALPA
jgi:hypothetical protein